MRLIQRVAVRLLEGDPEKEMAQVASLKGWVVAITVIMFIPGYYITGSMVKSAMLVLPVPLAYIGLVATIRFLGPVLDRYAKKLKEGG